MKVNEPTGYDVEITAEEVKVICKCKQVLQDIKETLEEKGCDTLVDSDSTVVDLETIAIMIIDLDTIMSVEKMY